MPINTKTDWLRQTLKYYNDNTGLFINDTLSADMKTARDCFLKKLSADAHILDFGCGSGRDTKVFLHAGFTVDAVDGAEELCCKAAEYTGIQVKHMLFQELDAVEEYDGIWACASILHLPKNELADVLRRIAVALKTSGILYTSFKYGTFEGIRNGRHYTDFTEETWAEFLSKIPTLKMTEKWITHDVRSDRREERWLNLILQKN